MKRPAYKYPAELTRVWTKERRKYNVQRQPAWMKKLKVGDVLTSRNGRVQRIVRAVTFYKCGNLHGVTFTIKHCSWTHRCSTSLIYTDLLARGLSPSGHHVKLKSRLDREIAKHLVNYHRRELDCCNVKGIP